MLLPKIARLFLFKPTEFLGMKDTEVVLLSDLLIKLNQNINESGDSIEVQFVSFRLTFRLLEVLCKRDSFDLESILKLIVKNCSVLLRSTELRHRMILILLDNLEKSNTIEITDFVNDNTKLLDNARIEKASEDEMKMTLKQFIKHLNDNVVKTKPKSQSTLSNSPKKGGLKALNKTVFQKKVFEKDTNTFVDLNNKPFDLVLRKIVRESNINQIVIEMITDLPLLTSLNQYMLQDSNIHLQKILDLLLIKQHTLSYNDLFQEIRNVLNYLMLASYGNCNLNFEHVTSFFLTTISILFNLYKSLVANSKCGDCETTKSAPKLKDVMVMLNYSFGVMTRLFSDLNMKEVRCCVVNINIILFNQTIKLIDDDTLRTLQSIPAFCQFSNSVLINVDLLIDSYKHESEIKRRSIIDPLQPVHIRELSQCSNYKWLTIILSERYNIFTIGWSFVNRSISLLMENENMKRSSILDTDQIPFLDEEEIANDGYGLNELFEESSSPPAPANAVVSESKKSTTLDSQFESAAHLLATLCQPTEIGGDISNLQLALLQNLLELFDNIMLLTIDDGDKNVNSMENAVTDNNMNDIVEKGLSSCVVLQEFMVFTEFIDKEIELNASDPKKCILLQKCRNIPKLLFQFINTLFSSNCINKDSIEYILNNFYFDEPNNKNRIRLNIGPVKITILLNISLAKITNSQSNTTKCDDNFITAIWNRFLGSIKHQSMSLLDDTTKYVDVSVDLIKFCLILYHSLDTAKSKEMIVESVLISISDFVNDQANKYSHTTKPYYLIRLLMLLNYFMHHFLDEDQHLLNNLQSSIRERLFETENHDKTNVIPSSASKPNENNPVSAGTSNTSQNYVYENLMCFSKEFVNAMFYDVTEIWKLTNPVCNGPKVDTMIWKRLNGLKNYPVYFDAVIQSLQIIMNQSTVETINKTPAFTKITSNDFLVVSQQPSVKLAMSFYGVLICSRLFQVLPPTDSYIEASMPPLETLSELLFYYSFNIHDVVINHSDLPIEKNVNASTIRELLAIHKPITIKEMTVGFEDYDLLQLRDLQRIFRLCHTILDICLADLTDNNNCKMFNLENVPSKMFQIDMVVMVIVYIYQIFQEDMGFSDFEQLRGSKSKKMDQMLNEPDVNMIILNQSLKIYKKLEKLLYFYLRDSDIIKTFEFQQGLMIILKNDTQNTISTESSGLNINLVYKLEKLTSEWIQKYTSLPPEKQQFYVDNANSTKLPMNHQITWPDMMKIFKSHRDFENFYTITKYKSIIEMIRVEGNRRITDILHLAHENTVNMISNITISCIGLAMEEMRYLISLVPNLNGDIEMAHQVLTTIVMSPSASLFEETGSYKKMCDNLLKDIPQSQYTLVFVEKTIQLLRYSLTVTIYDQNISNIINRTIHCIICIADNLYSKDDLSILPEFSKELNGIIPQLFDYLTMPDNKTIDASVRYSILRLFVVIIDIYNNSQKTTRNSSVEHWKRLVESIQQLGIPSRENKIDNWMNEVLLMDYNSDKKAEDKTGQKLPGDAEYLALLMIFVQRLVLIDDICDIDDLSASESVNVNLLGTSMINAIIKQNTHIKAWFSSILESNDNLHMNTCHNLPILVELLCHLSNSIRDCSMAMYATILEIMLEWSCRISQILENNSNSFLNQKYDSNVKSILNTLTLIYKQISAVLCALNSLYTLTDSSSDADVSYKNALMISPDAGFRLYLSETCFNLLGLDKSTIESILFFDPKNTLGINKKSNERTVPCSVIKFLRQSTSNYYNQENNSEDNSTSVQNNPMNPLDELLCTFGATNREFVDQPWYHCYTCDMVDHEGVCSICARVCHGSHDVAYSKRGSFFCDCGAKGMGTCSALQPRRGSVSITTPPATNIAASTSGTNVQQPNRPAKTLYPNAPTIIKKGTLKSTLLNRSIPPSETYANVASGSGSSGNMFIRNNCIRRKSGTTSNPTTSTGNGGSALLFPLPPPPSQSSNNKTQPQTPIMESQKPTGSTQPNGSNDKQPVSMLGSAKKIEARDKKPHQTAENIYRIWVTTVLRRRLSIESETLTVLLDTSSLLTDCMEAIKSISDRFGLIYQSWAIDRIEEMQKSFKKIRSEDKKVQQTIIMGSKSLEESSNRKHTGLPRSTKTSTLNASLDLSGIPPTQSLINDLPSINAQVRSMLQTGFIRRNVLAILSPTLTTKSKSSNNEDSKESLSSTRIHCHSYQQHFLAVAMSGNNSSGTSSASSRGHNSSGRLQIFRISELLSQAVKSDCRTVVIDPHYSNNSTNGLSEQSIELVSTATLPSVPLSLCVNVNSNHQWISICGLREIILVNVTPMGSVCSKFVLTPIFDDSTQFIVKSMWLTGSQTHLVVVVTHSVQIFDLSSTIEMNDSSSSKSSGVSASSIQYITQQPLFNFKSVESCFKDATFVYMRPNMMDSDDYLCYILVLTVSGTIHCKKLDQSCLGSDGFYLAETLDWNPEILDMSRDMKTGTLGKGGASIHYDQNLQLLIHSYHNGRTFFTVLSVSLEDGLYVEQNFQLQVSASESNRQEEPSQSSSNPTKDNLNSSALINWTSLTSGGQLGMLAAVSLGTMSPFYVIVEPEVFRYQLLDTKSLRLLENRINPEAVSSPSSDMAKVTDTITFPYIVDAKSRAVSLVLYYDGRVGIVCSSSESKDQYWLQPRFTNTYMYQCLEGVNHPVGFSTSTKDPYQFKEHMFSSSRNINSNNLLDRIFLPNPSHGLIPVDFFEHCEPMNDSTKIEFNSERLLEVYAHDVLNERLKTSNSPISIPSKCPMVINIINNTFETNRIVGLRVGICAIEIVKIPKYFEVFGRRVLVPDVSRSRFIDIGFYRNEIARCSKEFDLTIGLSRSTSDVTVIDQIIAFTRPKTSLPWLDGNDQLVMTANQPVDNLMTSFLTRGELRKHNFDMYAGGAPMSALLTKIKKEMLNVKFAYELICDIKTVDKASIEPPNCHVLSASLQLLTSYLHFKKGLEAQHKPSFSEMEIDVTIQPIQKMVHSLLVSYLPRDVTMNAIGLLSCVSRVKSLPNEGVTVENISNTGIDNINEQLDDNEFIKELLNILNEKNAEFIIKLQDKPASPIHMLQLESTILRLTNLVPRFISILKTQTESITEQLKHLISLTKLLVNYFTSFCCLNPLQLSEFNSINLSFASTSINPIYYYQIDYLPALLPTLINCILMLMYSLEFDNSHCEGAFKTIVDLLLHKNITISMNTRKALMSFLIAISSKSARKYQHSLNLESVAEPHEVTETNLMNTDDLPTPTPITPTITTTEASNVDHPTIMQTPEFSGPPHLESIRQQQNTNKGTSSSGPIDGKSNDGASACGNKIIYTPPPTDDDDVTDDDDNDDDDDDDDKGGQRNLTNVQSSEAASKSKASEPQELLNQYEEVDVNNDDSESDESDDGNADEDSDESNFESQPTTIPADIPKILKRLERVPNNNTDNPDNEDEPVNDPDMSEELMDALHHLMDEDAMVDLVIQKSLQEEVTRQSQEQREMQVEQPEGDDRSSTVIREPEGENNGPSTSTSHLTAQAKSVVKSGSVGSSDSDESDTNKRQAKSNKDQRNNDSWEMKAMGSRNNNNELVLDNYEDEFGVSEVMLHNVSREFETEDRKVRSDACKLLQPDNTHIQLLCRYLLKSLNERWEKYFQSITKPNTTSAPHNRSSLNRSQSLIKCVLDLTQRLDMSKAENAIIVHETIDKLGQIFDQINLTDLFQHIFKLATSYIVNSKKKKSESIVPDMKTDIGKLELGCVILKEMTSMIVVAYNNCNSLTNISTNNKINTCSTNFNSILNGSNSVLYSVLRMIKEKEIISKNILNVVSELVSKWDHQMDMMKSENSNNNSEIKHPLQEASIPSSVTMKEPASQTNQSSDSLPIQTMQLMIKLPYVMLKFHKSITYLHQQSQQQSNPSQDQEIGDLKDAAKSTKNISSSNTTKSNVIDLVTDISQNLFTQNKWSSILCQLIEIHLSDSITKHARLLLNSIVGPQRYRTVRDIHSIGQCMTKIKEFLYPNQNIPLNKIPDDDLMLSNQNQSDPFELEYSDLISLMQLLDQVISKVRDRPNNWRVFCCKCPDYLNMILKKSVLLNSTYPMISERFLYLLHLSLLEDKQSTASATSVSSNKIAITILSTNNYDSLKQIIRLFLNELVCNNDNIQCNLGFKYMAEAILERLLCCDESGELSYTLLNIWLEKANKSQISVPISDLISHMSFKSNVSDEFLNVFGNNLIKHLVRSIQNLFEVRQKGLEHNLSHWISGPLSLEPCSSCIHANCPSKLYKWDSEPTAASDARRSQISMKNSGANSPGLQLHHYYTFGNTNITTPTSNSTSKTGSASNQEDKIFATSLSPLVRASPNTHVFHLKSFYTIEFLQLKFTSTGFSSSTANSAAQNNTSICAAVTIYYSNCSTVSLSQMIESKHLWHKLGTHPLPRESSTSAGDIQLNLPAPITACYLMFSYDSSQQAINASLMAPNQGLMTSMVQQVANQIYKANSGSLQTPINLSHLNVQGQLSQQTGTPKCPRCHSTTIQGNVCMTCRDNINQCFRCRAINYAGTDSFVCSNCVSCRYGKIDFMMRARPNLDYVEKISSEEGYDAMLNRITKWSETIDKNRIVIDEIRSELEDDLISRCQTLNADDDFVLDEDYLDENDEDNDSDYGSSPQKASSPHKGAIIQAKKPQKPSNAIPTPSSNKKKLIQRLTGTTSTGVTTLTPTSNAAASTSSARNIRSSVDHFLKVEKATRRIRRPAGQPDPSMNNTTATHSSIITPEKDNRKKTENSPKMISTSAIGQSITKHQYKSGINKSNTRIHPALMHLAEKLKYEYQECLLEADVLNRQMKSARCSLAFYNKTTKEKHDESHQQIYKLDVDNTNYAVKAEVCSNNCYVCCLKQFEILIWMIRGVLLMEHKQDVNRRGLTTGKVLTEALNNHVAEEYGIDFIDLLLSSPLLEILESSKLRRQIISVAVLCTENQPKQISVLNKAIWSSISPYLTPTNISTCIVSDSKEQKMKWMIEALCISIGLSQRYYHPSTKRYNLIQPAVQNLENITDWQMRLRPAIAVLINVANYPLGLVSTQIMRNIILPSLSLLQAACEDNMALDENGQQGKACSDKICKGVNIIDLKKWLNEKIGENKVLKEWQLKRSNRLLLKYGRLWYQKTFKRTKKTSTFLIPTTINSRDYVKSTWSWLNHTLSVQYGGSRVLSSLLPQTTSNRLTSTPADVAVNVEEDGQIGEAIWTVVHTLAKESPERRKMIIQLLVGIMDRSQNVDQITLTRVSKMIRLLIIDSIELRCYLVIKTNFISILEKCFHCALKSMDQTEQSILIGWTSENNTQSQLRINQTRKTSRLSMNLLKSLAHLGLNLLEVPQISKRYREQFLRILMALSLSLRQLVALKTHETVQLEIMLNKTADSLSNHSEAGIQEYIKIALDVLNDFSRSDLHSSAHIIEKINSYINPRDYETLKFEVILDIFKGHEEYLPHRMFNMNLGMHLFGKRQPSLNDVLAFISRENNITSDFKMEVLCNQKNLKLELYLEDIYEQIWLTTEQGKQSPTLMRLTVRISGLTEDRLEYITTLNHSVPIEHYKRAEQLLVNQKQGLKCVLDRMGAAVQSRSLSNQNAPPLTKAAAVLTSCVRLFGYLTKIEENNLKLVQTEGCISILLDSVVKCLQEENTLDSKHQLEFEETTIIPLISLLTRLLTVGRREKNEEESVCHRELSQKRVGDIMFQLLDRVWYNSYIDLYQKHVTKLIPLLLLSDQPDRLKGFVNKLEPEFKLLVPLHDIHDVQRMLCCCSVLSAIPSSHQDSDSTKLRNQLAVDHCWMQKYVVDFLQNSVSSSNVSPTFFEQPGLPFVLELGLALTTGGNTESVAQIVLDSKGLLELLHKMEQTKVCSQSNIIVLVEDWLTALKSSGLTSVRTEIEQLRGEAKRNQQEKAKAFRQKQLAKIQQRLQKVAKPSAMSIVEDEDSLKCAICQEGYKSQPNELLGVYTYLRRFHIHDLTSQETVPGSQQSTSSPSSLSVVWLHASLSNFVCVHFKCHDKSIKSQNLHEWTAASRHNQNASCNAILPIMEPVQQVDASANKSPSNSPINYKTYITKYQLNTTPPPTISSTNPASFPATAHAESRMFMFLHDIKFFMLRFCHNRAFNEETGGGARLSNMNLMPHLLQGALYFLLLQPDIIEKELKCLLSYWTEEACKKSFSRIQQYETVWQIHSCPVRAIECLVFLPGFMWRKVRLLVLRTLLKYGMLRNLSNNNLQQEELEAKLLLGDQETTKWARPWLVFWCMLDSIYRSGILPNSQLSDKNETTVDQDMTAWRAKNPGCVSQYLRENKEQIQKACAEVVKEMEENFLCRYQDSGVIADGVFALEPLSTSLLSISHLEDDVTTANQDGGLRILSVDWFKELIKEIAE